MGVTSCVKRGYTSERAARLAHRSSGARIRVYACAACGFYHVTNQDKHAHERDFTAVPVPAKKGPRR